MTTENMFECALCGGSSPVPLQHSGNHCLVTNDRACLLQPHTGVEVALFGHSYSPEVIYTDSINWQLVGTIDRAILSVQVLHSDCQQSRDTSRVSRGKGSDY